MKSPARVAVFAAVPIEVVNLFLVLSSPLDSGFSADRNHWIKILHTQSSFLHLPGLVLYGWLGNEGLNNWGAFALICLAMGFLDTFLLIWGGISGFMWIRGMLQKSSATAG